MEGLLDGIELLPYKTNFAARTACEKEVGLISAIPSVKIEEEKQIFSLAPLMKSLNGQDYTVLFISRPLSQDIISKKRRALIQIKDQCFAVSKRNISRQQGISRSKGNTEGRTDTITKSTSNTISESFGWALGFTFSESYSETTSESLRPPKITARLSPTLSIKVRAFLQRYKMALPLN